MDVRGKLSCAQCVRIELSARLMNARAAPAGAAAVSFDPLTSRAQCRMMQRASMGSSAALRWALAESAGRPSGRCPARGSPAFASVSDLFQNLVSPPPSKGRNGRCVRAAPHAVRGAERLTRPPRSAPLVKGVVEPASFVPAHIPRPPYAETGELPAYRHGFQVQDAAVRLQHSPPRRRRLALTPPSLHRAW